LFFDAVLDGYKEKAENFLEVLKQFEVVEQRGKNKHKSA